MNKVFCQRADQTGHPCGGNRGGREIACRYSETGCLLDCHKLCSGYRPINDSLNVYTKSPKVFSGKSAGCGCCGKAGVVSAYSKLK